MAKSFEVNEKAFWWTSAAVTICWILIDKVFEMFNRMLNRDAFESMRGYFAQSQPDYFPLIYLVVMFLATAVVIRLYIMLIPELPASWITRGILAGLVLFAAVDLPNIIQAGYTTMLPGAAARGMAIMGLLSNLVNGCMMTYIYKRISGSLSK